MIDDASIQTAADAMQSEVIRLLALRMDQDSYLNAFLSFWCHGLNERELTQLMTAVRREACKQHRDIEEYLKESNFRVVKTWSEEKRGFDMDVVSGEQGCKVIPFNLVESVLTELAKTNDTIVHNGVTVFQRS